MEKNGLRFFFINKSACLNVIESNISLFINKIGVSLQPEEILEYIVSSSDLFKEGLCCSQALLGLLLGYGKENAIGFEKHFSKKRNLFRATPMNSSEIFHLEDEGLMIPGFASFSNKETWQIMRKYKKERGTIIDIYSNGNFLELTLKRLSSLPIEVYK